jgi:hypothetical protein
LDRLRNPGLKKVNELEKNRSQKRRTPRVCAGTQADCRAPVALETELFPEILIHFDLDSPVLGSTLCGLVVGNRFGLAESLT